ncbi:hypothetical protein BJX68DRAFT_232957 [Aspergillus pseudodeflectus]|uniref:Uncharacterized protein n=1 Tax=Aspergillus pseudodeflectus TaxID=176178 RepID=A0ABR4KPG1_9EURO
MMFQFSLVCYLVLLAFNPSASGFEAATIMISLSKHPVVQLPRFSFGQMPVV